MDKKYFFDSILFDEPEVDESAELEEDLPPPPPTFSEEELAQAKEEAFQEGVNQGRLDALASIEKDTALCLAGMQTQIEQLFTREAERNKLYEQEAVHLSLHIFKALYPHYARECGFDELQNFISDVITRQRDLRTVRIQVDPKLKSAIEEHILKLCSSNPEFSFEVVGDTSLEGSHNSLVSWGDGGAIYKPDAIAADIVEILQQTLAKDGFSSHDKEVVAEDAPSQIEHSVAQQNSPENTGLKPSIAPSKEEESLEEIPSEDENKDNGEA